MLQKIKIKLVFFVTLLLISATALSNQSFAQYIFEEDFESASGDGETIIGDDLPEWTHFTILGSVEWYSNSNDEATFAEMTSAGSGGNNITWLITPGIELEGEGDETFSFDISVGNFDGSAMIVLYATDYDGENPENANWAEYINVIELPDGPEEGFSDFENFTKPAPAISGEIHFAFDYAGNDNNGPRSVYRIDNVKVEGTATSRDPDEDLPGDFNLAQNYPNPFNPTTQISYELPEAADVHLEVFNTMGQRVAVLVNEQQQAGRHNISFDASGLAGGVYIYRMIANGNVFTEKMTLIK